MNEIKEYTEKVFEDIKHTDEFGNEYWLARELMPILQYNLWQNFHGIIKVAMNNCNNSNYNTLDHFIGVNKMVRIGSNTKRKIQDYKLSRYACYLIVLNCDPRKEVIALAKTYFAILTRKHELSEKEYNELTEDEKRLYRRNQARKGNYNLNKTADDIFKREKLRYREDILDNMGSEELADNIFRIAQTDAKLKRDKVDNEYTANSVHYEVGKEVRNSIKRLGGTMPEDLPTPNKSLKEFRKDEFDRLVYLHPNLLSKINELAQEFNYDYHYKPNDLIEIFSSRIQRQLYDLEHEQYIDCSYISICSAFPDLKPQIDALYDDYRNSIIQEDSIKKR